MTAIDTKHAALGGAGGFLGAATGPEQTCADGQGTWRQYAGGVIYHHPSTGAWSVVGAILSRWRTLGAERSVLGYPTSDETAAAVPDARVNTFQKGAVFWSGGTGACEVHGAIWAKYVAVGRESFLGLPRTDECVGPDLVGRYSRFTGGSISWHPSTGAREVHGFILGKWASLGEEGGLLGYPTSDETPVPGGAFSEFQRGRVYWTGGADCYEVHGLIRDRWLALGGPSGALGMPTSDEMPGADGTGRYGHFAAGGVFWHPTAGTRALIGAVWQHYRSLGCETSSLGYPTGEPQPTPDGGSSCTFQHGTISWHPATGATVS